jgi:hypothetical protein
MGNADGMSRRGNTSDFYVTPYPCITALLSRANIPKTATILDPCSGTGVIGKILRSSGYTSVTAYDIVDGFDFYAESSKYDVIIANPPYSHKNEFIKKAMEVANDVYMILPMTVNSYNRFHKQFLDIPPFKERFVMTPKFFMTEEETWKPKRGGISSYAWYHWKRDYNSSHSIEMYIDLDDFFMEE